MIPKEWDIRTIQDIAKVISGGTPSRTKPAYWGGNIPWVKTTEVQNCKIHKNNIFEFITDEGLKKSSAKIVPENTILLAMIGQGKTRGQTALLTFEATTNQNCAAIICNDNQDPVFFFNYLLSQYKNIRNLSNSAGQSNLSGRLVKSIKVPVPPFLEQKKIARILSTWDKAIKTVEKLIDNSKAQKKALMQQLLTGKRRLPRFGEEWEEVSISQFGKVVTGSTPPKSDESNFGGSISWATAESFHSKYIKNTNVKLTKSGAQKARIVPKGSVLVTCIASIGKNGIAAEDLATNQQINSIILHPYHSNEFLYYLIEYYKNKLIAWAGKTAIPILNKSSFEKIKFLTPSLEEQQQISIILITIDKKIEILQQKLDCLKQEKSALMQQLLTGKRRVKVDTNG